MSEVDVSSQSQHLHLDYHHVDVFADRPFTGNGLCVFTDVDLDAVPGAVLLAITQELRQFESIFLSAVDDDTVAARIFTEDEELGFAGHPVLGAAAVLHARRATTHSEGSWRFLIAGRAIEVATRRTNGSVNAEMNQGRADLLTTLGRADLETLLAHLNLAVGDLHATLPAQVITTGLPYLIVPVGQSGLARARILGSGFEARLAAHNAKFVYVFDPERREGRTWDNHGRIEDVATGSAAGPAGAYLIAQCLAEVGNAFTIQQGRFVGRPSEIHVRADRSTQEIHVGGAVAHVASGTLCAPA